MDRTVLLASLKVFLGIDADDASQDEQLLACIDGAIESCEEYLGRNLDGGEFSESIADVSNTLIVTNWPIADVYSIKDESGTAYPLDSIGWSARRNVIRLINCSALSRNACLITVEYKAGFFGTEIPQWVKLSVNYVAAAIYNLSGTGGSVSTGGTGELKKWAIPGVYSQEFDVSSDSSDDSDSSSFGIIPEVARQQLDFYRDRRIA